MGNQQAKEESSGVHNALSSLWSASSDKDDTCRTWGLVSLYYYFFICMDCVLVFVWHLAEQKGTHHRILHVFGTWTDMLCTSK